MRDLEILISKITKIIEGYIFSGRFGKSRFEINNAERFNEFVAEGKLVDEVETAAVDEPPSALKFIVGTAVKSSAYIYSFLESSIRWGTNNQITTHRFPTIKWLYAIRVKLISFNLEFEGLRTSAELLRFQNELFSLIDDLFSTVELMLKTAADDDKPIIKKVDGCEYELVGLLDNQSDLGKLFKNKLLDKKSVEDYRSQVKAALDKDILSKDDVICASNRVEKTARDMQGAVNLLQGRIEELTRERDLNRHMVEVRALQMNESDARQDELQKQLRLKDVARAELQSLVDKLASEKAKISKQLAALQKEDKTRAAQLQEDKSHQLALEAKMRELEESQVSAEQRAQEALAQVDLLKTDIERERVVQDGLKGQIAAMQEQARAVEDQLQQPLKVIEEQEQPAPQVQYTPLTEAEQRQLIFSIQGAEQSHDLAQLSKTLRDLQLSDDEQNDQVTDLELESSAVLSASESDERWKGLNVDKLNAHMRDHTAANFARPEAYPYLVEPDPELQCTTAQYFVRFTLLRKLSAALNANPNLLNAVCAGGENELKTKSLLEIALFYTDSRILKREERLEVLTYLLGRLPDIRNTSLYESIKENLNNPKVSCNVDLKTEYCLYATAHKTCSPTALDDFYEKYNAIKTAKAFLKKHAAVVVFDNKPVSQLLAEMQKELYACKLLCDGYLHGHFEAFKANTADAPKDGFASLNLVLLDALGQKESDKAYLRKHGRLHYQAEILSTLEPKYAACYRFTMGGTKHKFDAKVVEGVPISPNNNNDIPRGMKLFNAIDESLEPVLAAYGTLLKNMFLMISLYGVVLSTKDGFNKYQMLMINKRMGANLQAKKLMSDEGQRENGVMKKITSK